MNPSSSPARDAGPPATYTVTGDGLTVQRGGEVVLTIPPDRFPDLMVRLATVLRGLCSSAR